MTARGHGISRATAYCPCLDEIIAVLAEQAPGRSQALGTGWCRFPRRTLNRRVLHRVRIRDGLRVRGRSGGGISAGQRHHQGRLATSTQLPRTLKGFCADVTAQADAA